MTATTLKRSRPSRAGRPDRRGRLVWFGVVAAFVAAVAAAVVAIVSSSTDTPAQDRLSEDQRPGGMTEDGGFAFGPTFEPGTGSQGAPVLSVAVDYTCSYCADFEDRFAAELREKVSAGDITYVIYPVALLDDTGDYSGFSARAANAVATLATHAPGFTYPFHEALFEMYTDWSMDPSRSGQEPSNREIIDLATFLGVPQETADLIDDGLYLDWVEAATSDFTATGLGTPAVMVDDTLVMDWYEAPDLDTILDQAAGA